jgi:glycosyltransferase involved in cell wall biosynthesis
VGWGSVASTFEVRRFLAGQWVLKAAPFRPSPITETYDRLYQRYSRPPRLLLRVGQILNKTRNPLRGLSPDRYDVVHSTYAGFPRVLRGWGKPLVLTVHDITALRLPPALVPAGQAAITRRIMATVRPENWAICISEFTRRDFLAYRGHPVERSAVIPNGVDSTVFYACTSDSRLAEVRSRYRVPTGRYIFSVSSLAPHKNLKFLLQAWAAVPNKAPDQWLVVAGGKTTEPSQLAAALGLEPALLRQVVLTGFVPDEDLPQLISAAQAFAFPSLYEGFGLPVLEAMACGCPVLASNGSSIPEVVGLDGGVLIDPHDSPAWSVALAKVVNGAPRCKADERAIARALTFNWTGIAEAYRSLYASGIL